MKHATLSAFLLIGFGLAPALGLLGGGSMYYGTGGAAARQSADAADEMGTKGTIGDTARQKTAEDHETECYADAKGSTCSDHDTKPAQ